MGVRDALHIRLWLARQFAGQVQTENKRDVCISAAFLVDDAVEFRGDRSRALSAAVLERVCGGSGGVGGRVSLRRRRQDDRKAGGAGSAGAAGPASPTSASASGSPSSVGGVRDLLAALSRLADFADPSEDDRKAAEGGPSSLFVALSRSMFGKPQYALELQAIAAEWLLRSEHVVKVGRARSACLSLPLVLAGHG